MSEQPESDPPKPEAAPQPPPVEPHKKPQSVERRSVGRAVKENYVQNSAHYANGAVIISVLILLGGFIFQWRQDHLQRRQIDDLKQSQKETDKQAAALAAELGGLKTEMGGLKSTFEKSRDLV